MEQASECSGPALNEQITLGCLLLTQGESSQGSGVSMKQLELAHPAILGLRTLLPMIATAGGGFSSWLAHPSSISTEQEDVLVSARKIAIHVCLRDLLKSADLTPETPILRTERGGRAWPSGYVGSLTHKGTAILAALAPTTSMRMLGIDLEYLHARQSVSSIVSAIAPEGLPSGVNADLGAIYAFASKEAVFKAQHPVLGRELSFSEVRLRWKRVDMHGYEAVIENDPGLSNLQVKGLHIGKWIIAVSYLNA